MTTKCKQSTDTTRHWLGVYYRYTQVKYSIKNSVQNSLNCPVNVTGTKNRKYSVSSFKSAISDKQSSPMKTFGGQNEKYSSLLHDIDKELPEESDELMQSTEKMDVTKSKEKVYNPEMTVNKPEQRRKTVMKKMLKNIVNIFDLTLFKDPIYINIMIGMSLAIFAELNFSLLTPFILRDLTLNTSQTATFLSTLSVADLCFRFLAPFIGDYLNQPPRIMYCISLIMLIITRFSKKNEAVLHHNTDKLMILFRYINGWWLFSTDLRCCRFRHC